MRHLLVFSPGNASVAALLLGFAGLLIVGSVLVVSDTLRYASRL